MRCDDGGADVYFYEPHVRPKTYLQKGMRVRGMADEGEKGLAAISLQTEADWQQRPSLKQV